MARILDNRLTELGAKRVGPRPGRVRAPQSRPRRCRHLPPSRAPCGPLQTWCPSTPQRDPRRLRRQEPVPGSSDQRQRAVRGRRAQLRLWLVALVGEAEDVQEALDLVARVDGPQSDVVAGLVAVGARPQRDPRRLRRQEPVPGSSDQRQRAVRGRRAPLASSTWSSSCTSKSAASLPAPSSQPSSLWTASKSISTPWRASSTTA
jgi:hypothetical protein